MRKRIIALFLAGILVCGSTSAVYAAPEGDTEAAVTEEEETTEETVVPEESGTEMPVAEENAVTDTETEKASDMATEKPEIAEAEIITASEEYTITYVFLDIDGYTHSNPDSYHEGDSFSFTSARCEGYVFAGWYLDENFVQPITGITEDMTGNLTVYGRFVQEVTVSFDANGGTGYMSQVTVPAGTDTPLPTCTFTKDGYDFAGWNTAPDGSGRAVTSAADLEAGEITLYAQWKESGYTIRYVLKGGTNSAENPASYKDGTDTITLKAPTRKGCTFTGWYSDASLTKRSDTIPAGSTGDKTFYAGWKINRYNVKFYGNGATSGSMKALYNIAYSKTFSLKKNVFKRTGYTFTGWNTRADGSGTAYKNAASVKGLTAKNGVTVKLYAQWKKTVYRIVYHLNGGTNNAANPDTYTYSKKAVTLAAPTRAHCTFGGWYSNAKCTKRVTAIAKRSTGNKNLYAKWTINRYNVKFYGNGATSGSMKTLYNIAYTKTFSLTKNAFKRTGYKFAGWNTKADGTGTAYKNAASVAKLTGTNGRTVKLYAQWKPATYKITYYMNGGTNNATNPVSYTAADTADGAIKLKAPSDRPGYGYTFDHWSVCVTTSTTMRSIGTYIPKGTTGNLTAYAVWKYDSAQAAREKYNEEQAENTEYEFPVNICACGELLPTNCRVYLWNTKTNAYDLEKWCVVCPSWKTHNWSWTWDKAIIWEDDPEYERACQIAYYAVKGNNYSTMHCMFMGWDVPGEDVDNSEENSDRLSALDRAARKTEEGDYGAWGDACILMDINSYEYTFFDGLYKESYREIPVAYIKSLVDANGGSTFMDRYTS